MGCLTVETRKTYRAVLSVPKLVVPYGDFGTHATHDETEETPLPLHSSMSRLKLVYLASHSTNQNRHKKEKGILVEINPGLSTQFTNKIRPLMSICS